VKKTLLLATSIAVLAGIWTVIVLNVGAIGSIPFVLWPTFVAWAAFFYLGANGTAIRNGLVQLFTGAILSGLFLWIYGLIKVNDPAFIVLGIFVVIIAWPLTALSGVSKLWAAVPAGFCGAACWFGVSAANGTVGPWVVTIATLIPLLCGMFLGWLSLKIVTILMPEKKA
jgi:hypothetical protein